MARVKDVNQFINFRGGYAGINNPGGNVYWVAPSGYTAYDGGSPSDSNSGLSPQTALSTIQAGLDKCVSGRGDTVMLLPGSWTITAALTMTKADVTLRAAYEVGPQERSRVIIVLATDVNALTVDADDCTIYGITWDCNIAAATANTELIQLNSTNDTTDIYNTRIINCYFDYAGTDTDNDVIRVGLDSNDRAFNTLIEGCTIQDPDQDGIAITAGPGSVVRNCRIMDNFAASGKLCRYGINIASTDCLVEGCIIGTADTATPGGGIYVNSTLAQIHNNRIWARGANTIGILAAASATLTSSANFITAVAAGNIVDYTTDNTSPSANADAKGIFAATPGLAAFDTPTVGGS